jgi:hypothetical protein
MVKIATFDSHYLSGFKINWNEYEFKSSSFPIGIPSQFDESDPQTHSPSTDKTQSYRENVENQGCFRRITNSTNDDRLSYVFSKIME